MHNYKELKIWQKAKNLAKDIYKITNELPSMEHYGLTSQIERAAISIPANIAEGSGRGSNMEFSRFRDRVIGSLFELETEIIIGLGLNYY
jgi:four helix bundle protein